MQLSPLNIINRYHLSPAILLSWYFQVRKACKTGESQQFVNLTLRGKFKLTVKLVRSSFMISVCGWHLVLNLELGSETEAITAREMSHWSISHWTRLHVTLLWQLIIWSVAVCLTAAIFCEVFLQYMFLFCFVYSFSSFMQFTFDVCL